MNENKKVYFGICPYCSKMRIKNRGKRICCANCGSSYDGNLMTYKEARIQQSRLNKGESSFTPHVVRM